MELVCYCFKYSEEDVRADIARHGRSTLLEKIKEAKGQGDCNCAEKNPLGR
ncbi:bacterioferritin-associated ferredoxin [Desulfotalea psychrophila]|uniref:(2Fe-2S)-binding protein n=1 Tax=Desulfotalea psychrophila TaxID=84980 RepID=UPI00030C4362|nr:(2Fe-2S)-binding protein [Desulfotalea psychrophila]